MPNQKPSTAETVAAESVTEMAQPIIVDLGRQRADRLKDLKAGEGELWDDVLDVVDEVKEMLGAEAEGKLLLPIIMIYEKKSRRRIEQIIFPLANWDDDDDDTDDGDDDEEGDK